jgi:short-subunit dehydrogenase involved in D-alanine esterification of teichoic acids
VNRVTDAHPTLDSVLLNSGIQRPHDFTHPQSIDLALINTELTTNYLSYIHLVVALLPHLQSQSIPTSLIFTTSGLALVPNPRVSNYCASKAALHHLIMCVRERLKSSGSQVRIVEILPPAVKTELHDVKHQPDLKEGHHGLDLGEFTDETWKGLCEGKEEIPVGVVNVMFEELEKKRHVLFRRMVEVFKRM